jgi:hypothetical protein
MTTPSTANSKDASVPVRPFVEPESRGPGATNAVVKGEVGPRLPHERDESSDSGKGVPSEVIQKAADDMERGHVDELRGSHTQQHYSELTEKSHAQVKPV